METIILDDDPEPDTESTITFNFFDPKNHDLLGGDTPEKQGQEGKITFNPDGCQIFSLPPLENAGNIISDRYLIHIRFTLHEVPERGCYERVKFQGVMQDPRVIASDLFPDQIDCESKEKFYSFSANDLITEVTEAQQVCRRFRFRSLSPAISAFGEGDSFFFWVYSASPEEGGVKHGGKHGLVVLQVPHNMSSVIAEISMETAIARQSFRKWRSDKRITNTTAIKWDLTQAIPFCKAQVNTAPSPVDVGIIIALKEEFDEFFSEIQHDYVATRDADTGRYYYQFEHPNPDSNHPYRCMATFVGDMGSTKAGVLSEHVISLWKPGTLVMIGIAASIDSDVQLGDVIVPNQIDACMESSKATKAMNHDGFEFQLSGNVYLASVDLLHAAENFKFANRNIFQAWQQQCAQELEKLVPLELIARQLSKGLLREVPEITTGHLASGPTVGAARAFTAWLKKRDRKYNALDMEAGGLMTAVYEYADPKRTLILRAISDYGDERKARLDKEGLGAFRRYAVRNAVKLLWSFLDAGLLPRVTNSDSPTI